MSGTNLALLQPEDVRAELGRVHSDWRLGGVELVGAGLDFRVFRVESRDHGALVVRVPRSRYLSTAIDPRTDARDLLRQEVTLLEHVRRHGVPAPRVHSLSVDGGAFDFLVMDYLQNDGTDVDLVDFGRVLRRLHDCPPPALHSVMQTEATVAETLTTRTMRRMEIFRRATGRRIALPSFPEIVAAHRAWHGARSLLHLDARTDNFFINDSRIAGIVDWSNALIAPPALELARIAEFGYVAPGHRLDARFLEGYGEPAQTPPAVLDALYRLDTAVMLYVLFSQVIPDEARADAQEERVCLLAEEISDRIGEV